MAFNPEWVKEGKEMGATHLISVCDTFDWSDLKLGDAIDIRLDISLTTLSVNTTVEVDLQLGTGGGAYKIPFVTDADFKTAAVHTVNKFNGIYMGDTGTLDNGGDDITQGKADLGVGMVFPALGDDVVMKSPCLGGGRSQGREAIAVVDVQALGHGAHTMGGVDITVSP